MNLNSFGKKLVVNQMVTFMNKGITAAAGRMLFGRHKWVALVLFLLTMALESAQAAAPQNDNLASAKLIVGVSGNVLSSTLNATTEPGEPIHAVATSGASVWYRWVAPSSGSVTFSTDHSDTRYDTVLAVYTGNGFTNFTTVAANNDSANGNRALNLGAGFSSFLQFYANAGTTYYIAVAGANGDSGQFRLFWSMGGYAGTFQFTAANYESSDREGLTPANSIMNPFSFTGTRVTINRRDGYDGRVLVTYRVNDTATAVKGVNYNVNAAVDNSYIGNAQDLYVNGTNAWVTTAGLGGYGLRVIDVQNPLVPVHLTSMVLPGTPGRVFYRSTGQYNLLYIASGSGGLSVVDITTNTAPRLVGNINLGVTVNDVVVNASGTIAYLACADLGVFAIAVNEGALPASVGLNFISSFVNRNPNPTQTSTILGPTTVVIPNITAAEVNSDTINAPAHGMPLSTFTEFRFINSGGTMAAPFVSGTTYYAFPGNANSFQVFSAPNPANLINITGTNSGGSLTIQYNLSVNPVTDTIQTPGNHNLVNGTEIRFSGAGALPGGITGGVPYYAIVTGANTFRVSTTPGNPFSTLTTLDLTSSSYGNLTINGYDGRMSPVGSSMSVALSPAENTLYVADNLGGLVMLDVSNPNSMTFANRYASQGTALAARTFNNRLYMADGAQGVRVLDTTSSTTPGYLGALASSQGNVSNFSINQNALVGYTAAATGINAYNLNTVGLPASLGGFTTTATVNAAYSTAPLSPFVFAAEGLSGMQIINSPLANLYAPVSAAGAYAFSAFGSYTNSVIFDDWQASSSFVVTPISASVPTMDILSVKLLPGESPAILVPRIATTRRSSQVTILPTVGTGSYVERTRMRVAESAGSAVVRVFRGTAQNGDQTGYEINGSRVAPSNANAPQNNVYSLDSGSDYAAPAGANADFTPVSGVITWGNNTFTDISIPINNDNLAEFNEDFRFDLFQVPNNPPPGPNNHCYVTIVTDGQVDAEQTAGAVDPSYNRDYYNLSNPPFNPTPGANDQVHAVAVDSAQRAIFGGDFTAVNTDPSYPRLARFDANGNLDTTFTVGAGPNSSVLAIQVNTNQIYIAGKFNSYNAQQSQGIARLNSNGTLDTSFNVGAGVSNPSATPIRAMAVHRVGAHAGKVIAVGDFTTFAGQPRNRIVRLTSGGSLDGAFSIGSGANGPIYAVKVLENTGALGLDGYIMIAGDFTSFNGTAINRVARLTPTGAIDINYKPTSGANSTVYALDVLPTGKVLIGGAFTTVDFLSRPRVAQINVDGSVDTNFEVGTGADDIVYTAQYDANGQPLIGGLFRSFNYTRRAGYARLYNTGILDTSFMDIAYNHFAGLPMRYSPLAEPKPFVKSMAVQTNGDILIAGSFQKVGGGNRNTPPGLITNPTSASPWRDGQDIPIATPQWQNRDDIRNRSNIARVKGGSTPGPGNIGFTTAQYNVDEYSSLLFVTVSRTNTDPDTFALGDAQAEFYSDQSVTVAGSAISGLDYSSPANNLPRWRSNWTASDMVSQSRSGPNNVVLGTTRIEIPIINDNLIEGDETFGMRLINPRSTLSLGGLAANGEGETIHLGVALGRSTSTVKIIDDDFEPTFISFSKPRYTVTEDGGFATIDVIRTGSTTRSVSVDYYTTEHAGLAGGDIEETASQISDFEGAFGRLTFAPGQTNQSFTVPIVDDTVAEGDESLNMYLVNLSPGVSFGAASQNVASVNVATDTISIPGHGLYNDMQVTLSSDVVNGLPGGLASGVTYYVLVVDSDTIKLALAAGDVPVDITAPPTGNVTISAVQNLARLVIYDNDFSNGTLRFGSVKYTVNEGKTATITIQRTGGNVGAIQVDYTTVDGSATGGSDYVTTTGTLTWNHLDAAPKTITVPVNADGLVEGLEFFNVQLSQIKRLSDNFQYAPAVSSVPVEVVDADHLGSVKFASANFSVSEAGGKATITIVRSGGSSETAQVQIVDLGTGTAVSGMHYSFASPLTLFLAPGVTSANFTIDIVDDAGAPVQNPNRTINLQLNGIIADNLIDTATLTIVDNETVNEPAGAVDTTYNAAAGPDGFIYALALQSDEKLLLAGDFTKLNGISRSRLARLDKLGQIDNNFTVGTGASDSIRSIAMQDDGRILIAGLFTNYNGLNRNRIARLNENGILDLTFEPGAGADNPIYSVAISRDAVYYGKIVVGGDFNNIGGFNRPYVARLDTNGVVDTSFNTGTGPDGTVYAVAVQSDGKVLIGGEFSSVDQNANYPHFARLNADGSVDTTFNFASPLDGAVRAIVIQPDGKILVGGNFQNAGVTSRPFIARYNSDGQLDTSFDPGLGGDLPVLALCLQPDGKILVGGDFTRFSDVTRSRITRLNEDGSADSTINFGAGANSFVSALAVQPSDGRIIAGGGFTTFDGYTRNYLVRLYGGVIAGAGKFEFSQPLYTVSETQTNAVVLIRRTGGTTGNASVRISTADIMPAGLGKAVAGLDYEALDSVINFPNAETFKEVRVTISNDDLIEGDEYLNLILDQPSSALGNQPTAQLKISDDDSVVYFKQGVFSVNENTPSKYGQVELVRTGGLSGTITVRMETSDGTALAGADYTAVNSLLVFQPGETNKVITVPIIDDTVDEGNEFLNLTITKISGGGKVGDIAGNPSQAVMTIINDDFNYGVLQFSQQNYTVDENAGTVTLSVVRTNGSSGIVSVSYTTVSIGDAVGGVTAGTGVDYITTSGTLTFADRETVKTITVPILADAISTETNELFQVQLSNPTGKATLGFPNPSTVTIVNNNSAVFGTFNVVPFAALDEGGTYPITVNLANRINGATVTVDYKVVSGTAIEGVDFAPASGTLTFAANTTASFPLQILNDSLVEDDETFQIILSNPQPGNGPTIGTPITTGVIHSINQLPGTVVFHQPVFSALESSGTLNFVLDRTNGYTGAISVEVTLTAGTATEGVDYQNFPVSPMVFTWADGDRTSKTGSITILDDALVEADETIQLTMANATGSAVIGTPSAVAVILDDEVKAGSVDLTYNPILDGPVYGISINQTSAVASVVGDFHVVDGLTRSNVVQISSDGTVNNSFDPGSVSLLGSNANLRVVMNYTNGANVGKVLVAGRFDSINGVAITNIARLNADGSVDGTFSSVTTPNAPVSALVMQTDGKIIIGGDFNYVGTNAANFVARLNADGTVDTTFNVGSGGDAPVNALLLLDNGDLLVGGDFNLFGGIPSKKLARLTSTGSVVSSFSTNLGAGFDNSVFALAKQADTSLLIGGAFTNFNGNINNYLVCLNQDGTPETVKFTKFGTGFNDSVFAITLQPDKQILIGGNFTLFQGISHNRIIRLNTDGSVDSTINFGDGADSFVNAIALQADDKILVGGGFQYFNFQKHVGLVRLNNGINTGNGVFQFETPTFVANENDGLVKIIVSRILGTQKPVSIDLQTQDSTAVSPTHYQSLNTTLFFDEGETTKIVEIPVYDDVPAAVNANRVFDVKLSNPTNYSALLPVLDGSLLGFRTNATVTLVDNESVISFAANSFVVSENGGAAIIVLTRTGGSNDTVSVQFQTTTGTATPFVDYTPVTNTVIWAAGDLTPKTILIPILNDALVEGIETVNLQLTSYGNSALPGVTDSVLNIIDDDYSAGVVGFESATYNVLESQIAQVTVVRTNGSSGIVSVSLSTSNITAIAGNDYIGTNLVVTFANGETRKTVNIVTKDDALADDGETFLVHLSNITGGGVMGLSDTIVTIDDNDVTIGFSTNAVSVAESNTQLQLTVTRSGLLNRTFIIDYATANGTAQAGLDYQATSGVLVFGPNETNKTIQIPILEDFVIEVPEIFTVSVAGTNLSLVGNTTTTVTIDDNDLATDLEVMVSVNNPVKTNTVVQYSLLVTNYGPSDISGVILTNVLPASLQLQSVSVPNYSTIGNALIFDLPLLPKNTGYTVQINALDITGTIRSVTNIASLGLPAITNDSNLSNNSMTNVTTLRGPGPYLAVDSVALSSELPGPANGAFDIGEQVTLAVTFRNLGDVSSTAATASLRGTGGVVTNVGPQNASLGALLPNATATRNFSFQVAGTNGGTLVLTIDLADTGVVTYDPAVLRYRLGGANSFGTTNGIVLNDNAAATPYPAIINVSGMVGVVDQVSLTLSNVYHSYPGDIDMLLVAPNGQSVMVMSDAGSGNKLVNTTFTITDLASADLPNNGQIANNTSYRPKDYFIPTAGDDGFIAPAPAGPYFSAMSAFKGIDPNGNWQLYVRDDSAGDFGIISNGWSLNISTVFPANQTAGLVVAGTQNAGPILVGSNVTYTIVVTNHGPSSASGVYLTNLFSGAFTPVSVTNSVGGSTTFPSGRVVLSLGTMANGAAVTNIITVLPTAAGSFTNLATLGIAGGQTDPFLGDNSIIFAQTVTASADLVVGVSTSPSGPVALGNNLTYTIAVTNLGPSTATSVVLTNILPSGVNYVSGTSSQGILSRSGSLVTANLGSLAVNGTAQLNIIVTPTASGTLSNSVTAYSAISDPNLVNNQAVTTTTAVTDSADLKISMTGAPSPVTLSSNITYTITVTNLGPSTASGVVVTNPLPGAVTLVSYTNTQGTASVTGGAVVFSLGAVPVGTTATMSIVVTANAVGAVNNTAIVAATGTFDPVSANNSATVAIAVQSLAANIEVGSSLLVSESSAPSNGAIDSGETVTVRLELANKGVAATGNLVATLLPTGGVATNSGPQVKTYGAIASGSSAAQNFTFTANGNLGDTLSVTLQLQDGASNLGTVTFTFQLGETVRAGSGTAILGVDVGPALTYPSTVNISGVGGTILKLTVTLTNVSHTFPDDFDILLVSPSGRKVILMSDAGGGFAINNVNLTFDDSATSYLPDSGQITSGVYRPSNYLNSPVDATSTNDVFSAPAPSGPYGSTLTDFVGENPNGNWQLYVMDDQSGNIGNIGGWSLSLVTVSTLAPSADVAVAVTASSASVTARSNVTYTITVTNRGPNTVSGVTVTNSLPTNAVLASLAAAQGAIGTNAAGKVVWTIGSMTANSQYQAVVVAAPQVPGSATNTTTVAHTDIELNSSNNTSSVITTVNGFVLSGSSVNVSPSSVSLMLLGQPNVTYTIEASSDLVNWVVIGTSTSADGVITINDPAGSSSGLRFYRARQ